MNDKLFALRLFARAARTGSFSVAGRDLGLSQPSASRLIAALEAEVGASLFSRTTRAVTLTETGTTYLSRVDAILREVDEADHEARGTGELRGTLRAGLSSSFAVREIIPRLPRFVDQHPALRVELLMSDRHQDLVTEGLDLVLRFGPLTDSNAVARKILALPRILAASPNYLTQRGLPHEPADLASHTVIAGPSNPIPVLSFQREGRTTSVRVSGRIAISLNEGALTAAVAGLGIVASSLGSCITELKNGTLVRILTEWDMGNVEIHAVYANGHAARPAARSFADFLIEEFHDWEHT